MQTRTVEQVESWDARPFSGEVRELHDLADDGFSGTVVADDTWAFFLNGRVVGVFQGDIDDVIGTEGTVYTAPDSSLPLLFSMQERGGETRAKYFTNDTPVKTVDETLREANFTGYLELSENVLSGDYYVSYYGGKSLSTAFVGQSERLVTGDEAFEMVNDEVGVFEVRDVSFGITELPKINEEGPDSEVSDDAPVAESPDHSTTDAESDSTSEGGQSDEEPATATAAVDSETSEGSEEADPAPTGTSEPNIEDAEPSTDPEPSDPGAVEETVGAAESPPSADDQPTDPESSTEGTATPTSPVTDDEPSSAHERAVREWAEKDRSQRDDGQNDLFREEAEWRKTTSIPALDPDESGPDASARDDSRPTSSSTRESTSSHRSNAPSPERTGSTDTRARESRSSQGSKTAAQSGSKRESPSDREGSTESEPADSPEPTTTSAAADPRIEELESELSTIESKRDDLEDTVTELRDERSSLEERIDTLESKLETADRDSSMGSPIGPGDLPPTEAIAGTNVFVRYDSKGKPTLDALDGTSVDPDTVNENLRLDHHTTFEASDATVDGRPYEEFLHETSRFKFVEWLVRELPYELLDSGARQGLEKVYDAIPEIDRVEFDGTIDVESSEDGPSSYTFDVVIRDRMGNPLVVADTNDARDPVDQESMDELVSGATTIGTANDSLAGAFYVTTSYFDPKALERAQDATDDGGFFSRSGKESFVKVGRKRGYHLCLVEDRRDSFHVTVPEL